LLFGIDIDILVVGKLGVVRLFLTEIRRICIGVMRSKVGLNTPFPLLAVLFVSACILILSSNSFGQTSYYVSASGNDANDGKSASTPWKTISKVNSLTFSSGDAILFRCGDTFYGQITALSGVTYGAYGTGSKPIISGAITLSGWTVYSGSIYQCTASSSIYNLFCNGVQMIKARSPNTGFYAASGGSGTSLTSSSINQSYSWVGGVVRERGCDWTWENRTITASSSGSVSWSGSVSYSPFSGSQFYLEGALGALDVANEWFCNTSTKQVYFYAPGGVDPSTLTVVGSVQNYGVTGSGKSNVTVRDLDFRYQMIAGVYFSGTYSGNSILSCDIRGCKVYGVYFAGTATSCKIDGDSIQDCSTAGIAGGCASATITNNVIQRIGVIPGYGESSYGPNGLPSGIYNFSGANSEIAHNTIDSTGYSGININSVTFTNSIIEDNTIKATMSTLGDGGAIYMYGTNSYTIRNNTIIDCYGYTNSISPTSGYQSFGIYFDSGTHDIIVTGNTVVRARDCGLYIQGMAGGSSHNITFRNNTLIDCGASSNYGSPLALEQYPSLAYGGNVITKNKIFKPNITPKYVWFFYNWSGTPSAGTIDSNYYATGSTQFRYTSSFYSLAQWQSNTSYDAHSSQSATITLTSGNNQSQAVNTTLSLPLKVTTTVSGWGMPGFHVLYTVTGPSGATGQSLSASDVTTAEDGTANAYLTLGNKAGTYTVTATVSGLTGSPITFTATATDSDPPAPDSITVHRVIVPLGWNMISTFVAPYQPAIDSIFSNINSKVTIVKDGSGRVYYPSFNINNLGSWQPYQGYQVCMSSADTVSFRGRVLPPEQNPMSLSAGWNLVSYLRNDLMAADSALATIASSLIIAKNAVGEVYMPSYGINAMGAMKPGQGYQIYVQNPSTLTYPANTNPTPTNVLSKKQSTSLASSSHGTEHFKPAYQETGANGLVLVKCNSLKNGDEIAVSMSHGKIVGSGTVKEGLASVTVWGDNDQTVVVEGPRDGETLTLISWSKERDETTPLQIKSLKNGLTGEPQKTTLVYRKDCLWVLEALEDCELDQIPTEYSLSQNYPNPFNPSTLIRYGLPLDVKVSLEVFDLLGHLVTCLVDETQKSGYHEAHFDGSGLASGIYFYRLASGGFFETKKLLLLK
jgi:hypothetical protein